MSNSNPTQGTGKLALPKDIYDVAKDVAMIYLPALGVFYAAIAAIWNLPDAVEVSGTIVAVDALLGAWLKISSASFNNSSKSVDGTVDVINKATGSASPQKISVDLTPEELADKDKITLAVHAVDETPPSSIGSMDPRNVTDDPSQ